MLYRTLARALWRASFCSFARFCARAPVRSLCVFVFRVSVGGWWFDVPRLRGVVRVSPG